VADGSASRMVPDGKSPKVTGGADLSINSRGYSSNRFAIAVALALSVQPRNNNSDD